MIFEHWNKIKKNNVNFPQSLIVNINSSTNIGLLINNYARIIFEQEIADINLRNSAIAKIENNQYQDLFFINNKEDLLYTKKDLEILFDQLMYTTIEDSQIRFVIINYAEKLDIKTSNMLLKFIEEPIEKTYIMLITNNINTLLDTIKSRCQVFSLTTEKSKLELLKEKYQNNEVLLCLIHSNKTIDEIEKLFFDKKYLAIFEWAKNFIDIKNKKNLAIDLTNVQKVFKFFDYYQINLAIEILIYFLDQENDKHTSIKKIKKLFDLQFDLHLNVNKTLIFLMIHQIIME